MVWHQGQRTARSGSGGAAGGFAYGDYLRCGAMAAQSQVMKAIKAHAEKARSAGHLQRLSGLDRSGASAGRLDAQCRAEIRLQAGDPFRWKETQSAFTRKYEKGQSVTFPVAPWRRQLLRRWRYLDRLERRRPGDVPLSGQSQRLGPRHRRYSQSKAQCAGPDASTLPER